MVIASSHGVEISTNAANKKPAWGRGKRGAVNTSRPLALSLGFDCMDPLNEVCLDADQSEIVARSVFLWGRGLIVIAMPVLSVAR